MKSPSTVSHEVNRNGGSVRYRTIAADKYALKKALGPKAYKLRKSRPISKLVYDWSPEQISGWLKEHIINHLKCRYYMRQFISPCLFYVVKFLL